MRHNLTKISTFATIMKSKRAFYVSTNVILYKVTPSMMPFLHFIE